jgi:Ran GTPase-activating protein (RanGAP) involved in mRNA processing and transport
MSEQSVEKGQTQYVKQYCQGIGEKLKYLLWVTKEHKKTGKCEHRLLAVTSYRVLTFKGSRTLKKCHNDHMYNLKSLVYKQEKRLELHFESWFIKFSHSRATGMLVKYLCEIIHRICCLWPTVAKPKIDANQVLLAELNVTPFDASEENGASGFLATYDALCSLYSVPACMAFRSKVTNAFLQNDHRLYVSWHDVPLECGHIQAFAGSILHDTWFTDVSFGLGIRGSPLEITDGAVDTIGPTLATVRHIQHLRLCRSCLSSKGARSLVHALQANHGMQLQLLDLSHNALGDPIVSELAVCLVHAHTSLQELHLNSVGMTSSGLSSMIDTFFQSPDICKKGISVLTIAHNILGKRGTTKLIEYIVSTAGASLTQLDISATGIDSAELANALRSSSHAKLLSLSLGENRLNPDSTAALCRLLSSTAILSDVRLDGVINSSNETNNRKDRLALEAVSATLLFNTHLYKAKLSLRNNSLGSNYSRKLAAMCRDSHILVKLDISDCGIGDDALAMLFQGLSESVTPRLEVLNVARNSKANEDFGASKWLVRMFNHLKVLKSLDVSGGRDRKTTKSKLYWSLDLKPFFKNLKDTDTSIVTINASCNGLKDTDVNLLINSINNRSTLKTVDIRGNENVTSLTAKRLMAILK